MDSIDSSPGDNATIDSAKNYSISWKAQASLQGGHVEYEFHVLTIREPIVYGE
jgi:hypothetical protein